MGDWQEIAKTDKQKASVELLQEALRTIAVNTPKSKSAVIARQALDRSYALAAGYMPGF